MLMVVIIALGNDKDLGFIDFQLFPGLEGTDPGSLKRHDSKYSRICGYNFASSSSSSSSKILFQQDSCIYKVIVGLHTGPA